MPIGIPEKFCEICGDLLILQNTRDIIRKRFCSRTCLGTWNGKRNGRPHTDGAKMKMSISSRKFYAENPEAKERATNQLRAMRRPIGSKNSEEHNRAVSEGSKRHAALELPECNCWIHNPYKHSWYDLSPLQWHLIDFLAARFEVVVPEAQFNRFRVDALLANEWIAFEADGTGWHLDKEKDMRRDQELWDKFDLPVVRLSQDEVRALIDGNFDS